MAGAHDAGAAPPGVTLVVDGTAITEVPRERLRTPTALASLLPGRLAAWRDITAETADGRTLYVQRPAELYRGQEARLWIDEHGDAALGMWRMVDPGAPAATRTLAARPTVALGGILQVAVRTRERAEAPAAEHAGIAVVAGERRATLRAADLAALPPAASPRGDERRESWDLLAVVRRALPGAHPARLRLRGAGQEPVVVDVAPLERGERAARLKLNRKGEARVRVWIPGDPPRVEVEVRDLDAVELE